jgi:hypothetical protein
LNDEYLIGTKNAFNTTLKHLQGKNAFTEYKLKVYFFEVSMPSNSELNGIFNICNHDALVCFKVYSQGCKSLKTLGR